MICQEVFLGALHPTVRNRQIRLSFHQRLNEAQETIRMSGDVISRKVFCPRSYEAGV